MNEVSEEAIEAAVRASYLRHDWNDEYSRKFIERALKAAAPHMRPHLPTRNDKDAA